MRPTLPNTVELTGWIYHSTLWLDLSELSQLLGVGRLVEFQRRFARIESILLAASRFGICDPDAA